MEILILFISFFLSSKIFANSCVKKDATKCLLRETPECLSQSVAYEKKFTKPAENEKEKKKITGGMELWEDEADDGGAFFFQRMKEKPEERAKERHFNNIPSVRPV